MFRDIEFYTTKKKICLYPNSSLEVNWKARYVSYLGVIATSRTWIGFIQVLTTADGIAGITLTVGVLFVI